VVERESGVDGGVHAIHCEPQAADVTGTDLVSCHQHRWQMRQLCW
jgi:hypothetical protein